MLLPVTTRAEPGGAAGVLPRHFVEFIPAVVPPGTPDSHDQRHRRQEPEGPAAAVDVAPSAVSAPAADRQLFSHRLARWEPVAQAIGQASQAIVGFLRSVGVPQAEAEDVARRVAEAARERLSAEARATQAHYEAGRLSLRLEKVEVGFRRGRPELRLGKAEIGVDVDIPGARREDSGVKLGRTEAEFGGRAVAFEYRGPGATPAYVDRGASGLSFEVAAPLAAPSITPQSGPVDVAI
jgi:hypothetical protein